ncbi:hypothetical protein MKK69_30450 [Methylobacterium sp. J-026]|uniref:hypothetical protein n=1 Tax=Methylobacterium sp. J-026 TaxID=2836624 RepID=UPI001FBAC2BB|nr:hypothetical protein [Methylobacterium sp. J-026]MCJ2138324.1 hypothetical protein [Methylobacterium sp. J-026]
MTKSETTPAVSPADLLKAVVTGQADAGGETATSEPRTRKRAAREALAQIDLRRLAIPGACLAVGALLGGGVIAATRSAALPNDAVLALSTTLDAGRTETARLGSDIAQLHQVLADLRASTDTARKEATARSGALSERLAQLDKTLAAKTAALGERLEQVEREQNVRIAGLAAQIERRSPPVTPVAKAEPTQTGSLAETRSVEPKAGDAKITEARLADIKPADAKPKAPAVEKTPVIDGWAVRDVYDGMAILENRRHRLLEIGPGEVLPGFGRVEGVERRGRDWVVVTRQGLVTPQPW